LQAVQHPDLLVGLENLDDAAVYRISDDAALVQTVDFFTPIVDEAYDWGRITAANALSDVYAMGGRPLTALQLVGWPRERLSLDLLGEVLEGGAAVLAEAGCTLVGGHSVDDPEPKYGFAVTGLVDPERMVTKAGARVGDRLVLTKPLGTGIVSTAIKQEKATPELRDEAVRMMTTLNEGAARAMLAVGVHAATDVTGYGLLGHLGEMVRASGVGAVLEADRVPVIEGVAELAAQDVYPGGSRRNLKSASRFTDFGSLDEPYRRVLADAQTSGGLLLAVPSDRAPDLVEWLGGVAPRAAVIGEVTEQPAGRIEVRG
jgi:selenide,water dikinase